MPVASVRAQFAPRLRPRKAAPTSGANRRTSNAPAASGTTPTTAMIVPPVAPIAIPPAIGAPPATIRRPRPAPSPSAERQPGPLPRDHARFHARGAEPSLGRGTGGDRATTPGPAQKRDRVQITYVTSLDGAFTKATCNRELSGLLAAKGIEVTTEFNTGQVDGTAGKLVSWDGREVPFDLLVTIPLHGGAEFVSRSPGLGDDLGFVAVDRATLQAEVRPNVFAIGDATNVPTSKAGSVAHFEGETLVENIRRYLDGRQLESSFDGHTNCFIETGFHKALLIDFNYEIEPLPGKFPKPHIGPLRLLGESRLNHLGKLAFEWVYWHMLLPGREMPGISSQMKLAGKHTDLPANQGAPR
jgi:hypothetical protein